MEFNERKIKLVMLYIASKQDWSINIDDLLSIMFIADKKHLRDWGDPIVYGDYEYSLSRRKLAEEIMKKDFTLDPRDFVTEETRPNLTIEAINHELSKSETDAIDEAYLSYKEK